MAYKDVKCWTKRLPRRRTQKAKKVREENKSFFELRGVEMVKGAPFPYTHAVTFI